MSRVRYTSTMQVRWMFALGLFAACSGKSGDSGSGSATAGSSVPPAPTASADAATGSAAPTAIKVSALPGIDAAAICADSAVLLVDVPLAEAGAKYCAAGGASDSKACSAKWPDDVIEPGK